MKPQTFQLNDGAKRTPTLIVVDTETVPSGRLVYAGTGPVTRDQDDVRRYATAARNGMKV